MPRIMTYVCDMVSLITSCASTVTFKCCGDNNSGRKQSNHSKYCNDDGLFVEVNHNSIVKNGLRESRVLAA